MKNKLLNWENKRLNRAFASVIPSHSGVYAIVAAKRVLNFPAQMELLYIGKSKNLRRRFLEHADPWLEHNHALKQVALNENLEFWHAFVNEDLLDITERQLISQANPPANVITYGARK